MADSSSKGTIQHSNSLSLIGDGIVSETERSRQLTEATGHSPHDSTRTNRLRSGSFSIPTLENLGGCNWGKKEREIIKKEEGIPFFLLEQFSLFE